MNRWSLASLACSLALVAACKPSDLVELRLYPCEFAGVVPQAVTVEITGYAADDSVVETFEVPFDDIAATTFADGYATVGYRKQGEVVRARFRVGWFDEASAGPIAEADAIAVYDELVPDAGEVLVLGELAADCAQLIGDGTESGESMDDSGSESMSDSDSGSGSESIDGESDSESTSDTTDATETTDTSDTTDTTGDEPPGPLPGDECFIAGSFYCRGGPTPEDAGIPLFCPFDPPLFLEVTDTFPIACGGSCLDGAAAPVDACGNIGVDAKCLCLSPGAPDCTDAPLGCMNGGELHLCHQGKVVVADCPNCGTSPEGWFTCD